MDQLPCLVIRIKDVSSVIAPYGAHVCIEAAVLFRGEGLGHTHLLKVSIDVSDLLAALGDNGDEFVKLVLVLLLFLFQLGDLLVGEE